MIDEVQCHSRLHRHRAAFGLAAILAFASCSDADCQTSCLPYGTYVELNAELDTATAKICFDDECTTVRPGEGDGTGDGNVTTGFYSNEWQDGRRVHLTIDVFDSTGAILDSVDETRTMDTSGCSCGVFFYGWRDGHLHKIN